MSSSPRSRRVGWIFGGAYLVLLAAIAFAPGNVDSALYPALVHTLDRLQQLGAPGWLTYSAVEFLANVLLFVPLGVLLVLLLGPRRWAWAMVLGVGVSAIIEATQGLFLSNRVSALRDVVANGAGALVGAAVTVAVLAAIRRQRSASRGDQSIV